MSQNGIRAGHYLYIIMNFNINLFIDESSTMDEDMGGGEGVASSDDVNDISSAAQEVLSTGIRYSTKHKMYAWCYL